MLFVVVDVDLSSGADNLLALISNPVRYGLQETQPGHPTHLPASRVLEVILLQQSRWWMSIPSGFPDDGGRLLQFSE